MRHRTTLFLLALLTIVARHAHAASYQPCPYVTGGWSQSWTGHAITSATYDGTTLQLYVIFGSRIPTAFVGVPYPVMQSFSRAQNPDSFYQTSLFPVYHTLLLSETNNCPLLFQTGVQIWSK